VGLDWSSPTVKRLRWLPTVILGTTFIVYWGSIVLKGQGDFPNHWEMGRRMLSGEFLYDGDLDFVYPPFWALAHAPLALIDVHMAQIMAYALAPLALAGLLWTMHQLTQKLLPLDSDRLFWSTTVSLTLAFHFVTRDHPEIGINTALVALSWFAIYLWTKERDGAAGLTLGLAAALKSTPLLFVAYFGLKREWKMVAASTSAFVLFSLSPMIMQGPDQYVRTMQT